MREIKFRAWDKSANEMIPWKPMQAWMIGVLEDPYVMQFTGLKDKNGKEIYEGDIIKSQWQHDGQNNYDYEIIGEVKWNGEYLQYTIEAEQNDKTGTIWYPLHSFEREELLDEGLVVIGNIYENPELIK